MKFVRVNEAEYFRLMCTVFEEVIKDYGSDSNRECLTVFSNRVHTKLFSKGRNETTENVRKTMREVFGVG